MRPSHAGQARLDRLAHRRTAASARGQRVCRQPSRTPGAISTPKPPPRPSSSCQCWHAKRPTALARAREVAEGIVFGAKANLDARKRFAGRYLLNTLKNLAVIAREGNAGALFGTVARTHLRSSRRRDRRSIETSRRYRRMPIARLIISVDTACSVSAARGWHRPASGGRRGIPATSTGRHLSKRPTRVAHGWWPKAAWIRRSSSSSRDARSSSR